MAARTRGLAFLVGLIAISAPAAAQVPAYLEPGTPTSESTGRVMNIGMSAYQYAFSNKGEFPPDLASVVALMWSDRERGEGTPADVIRKYAMKAGEESRVPDNATIDWVNEHGSYVLAIPPGINTKDLPAWDKIIVAHLRPELAHRVEPSERNPEGELIAVSLLYGAGTLLTRRDFAEQMAMSNAIIDAVKSGGPFPDAVQVQADLTAIGSAFRGYAGANEGKLPPDLGSLLPYIPDDTRRLSTPKDRVRVFLSPHAARNTNIPEEPDAEWINRHTAYAYLGTDAAKLDEIDDMRLVLVHAKLDAHLGSDPGGKPIKHIPMLTVRNGFDSSERDYAKVCIAEAREYFDAVRAGRELPDRHHMLRDLRYIYKAILEYGKAHEGRLPPDLAATIEYLPADDFTAANAANIYLSPRAQRGRGEVPEKPTAEWVREHGNYVYLGSNRYTRREFTRKCDLLVHSPLNETFIQRWPQSQTECVAGLRPDGIVWQPCMQVFEEDLAKLREAR